MARRVIFLLVSASVLVACVASTETPTSVVKETPVSSAPIQRTAEPYPSPFTSGQDSNPYPAPGTPASTQSAYPPSPTDSINAPGVPPSGYDPQESDLALERGPVYLDIGASSIVSAESFPVQISVVINGNLPDPCHRLRVVVSPPNPQNQINLEVYSVYEAGTICVTMLKPFSATIPLGTFSTGHYLVFANGELVGEFDT